MAFIVVGNYYQFTQQKRIMCAKKEITKSNVITFSTWYDIKPVVVMPKMKIRFKKCRSVSLNRLKKQNKLNVRNKKPDQILCTAVFFILFALPHQHQFNETAPESSHGK